MSFLTLAVVATADIVSLRFYHICTEEKSGMDVVPVFISVDPERDTVQQVHEYVKGSPSS